MLCFFSLQPSAFEEKAIEKVDDLLESYMGIRDSELGNCECVWVCVCGFICWFQFTKCCLTSLRLRSGDHGGAGKGQKEP